ncbi:MAG: integrase [Gammaproteobacteria bacterium]|nr:MAG: integrase [Gammaproteobacteria bacterium]
MQPGALAKHLAGFTQELESVGYAQLTVAGYSMSAAHFAEWARRRDQGEADWSADAIDRFARHRCCCFGGRRWHRVSGKYVRRVRRFIHYLERQGVIASCAEAQPVAPLPEFSDWLALHRGVSARTIERYVGALSRLLPAAGEDRTTFTALRVRQLVLSHVRGHSTSYARCVVTALRVYLRFLASQGHCPAGLDRSIPTIPQWRLSALPRYLPADEIERVVAACDIATPVGVRDRAVLLLLARLGLRAGDVVKLGLADIDWHAATLKVCGKGRRDVRLPLPQDAGDAVLAYLQHARPRVAIDRVFLCLRAPYRPFRRSGTISSIVSAALHRAGVCQPPSRGANLLRHSAATALLRAGASLDAVSSLLRHRSLDMTAHYAKVDVAMLTSVAQPWPEGVPC